MPARGEIIDVVEAVIEDIAPLRRGRLYAEAEEGQTRDAHDGAADVQRGLHDDGREGVRDDVGHDDLEVRLAEGAGRLDVFLAVDEHGARAQLPGDHGDRADGEGERGVEHAGAQRHRDADGEHHAGDGHDDVHDAHEDGVDIFAEEAAQRADDHAEHDADGDGEDRNEERIPSAHQKAGQKIAAIVVRTHPVGLRGGLEALGQVLRGVVIGAERRGKNDAEDHDHEEDKADHGHGVLFEPVPDLAPIAALFQTHGLVLLGLGDRGVFHLGHAALASFSGSFFFFLPLAVYWALMRGSTAA